MEVLVTNDDVMCKICGHDIDYHDSDGCFVGMCECKQINSISYYEMLYGDRGIIWP